MSGLGKLGESYVREATRRMKRALRGAPEDLRLLAAAAINSGRLLTGESVTSDGLAEVVRHARAMRSAVQGNKAMRAKRRREADGAAFLLIEAAYLLSGRAGLPSPI